MGLLVYLYGIHPYGLCKCVLMNPLLGPLTNSLCIIECAQKIHVDYIRMFCLLKVRCFTYFLHYPFNEFMSTDFIMSAL